MSDVLITGCSTGFAYEAACRLARRGHRVFATMWDVADRPTVASAAIEPLLGRITTPSSCGRW